MATIVERPNTEAEPLPGVEETQETPKVEENPVPEKYRGKSVEELVRMHQEAEKVIGRQGSEAGDLRKVVDDYIQAKLTENKEPAEKVDFYTDPEKAISRAIENHPLIQEAQKTTQESRKQTAINMMKAKHPDMLDLLGNPNFLEWVKESPVRTRLLNQANGQYDVDAADEVFSTWKERQRLIQETVQHDRKAAIKSASTGGKSGNADMSTKKIFRRADIIKLMNDDPQRYNALAAEIRQAYAEGRVK